MINLKSIISDARDKFMSVNVLFLSKTHLELVKRKIQD